MYEVKGRINEDESCHWLIEQAADIVEAVKVALDHGMYEIYAAHLSKVQEVFDREDGGVWYKADVKEEQVIPQEDGKQPKTRTLSYQMLVRAKSLGEANGILEEQLKQGYGLVTYGLRESRIDDVI